MGWGRTVQQQGSRLLRAAFQRLSREAASVIYRQLRLPRAGGREASPGASKPGAKQSQTGGRERGHSCPLCSASPPCCPMLIKCFSQLKV